MAQIFVFGFVGNDLEIKKSQSDSSYVCFHLYEQTGKGRTQSYQVWAWGEDVSRLTRLGVKKGSLIWVCGTLHLVDCTTGHGKTKTKLLKLSLANWGYVPSRHSTQQPENVSNETGIFPATPVPSAEVLDGDRETLPE